VGAGFPSEAPLSYRQWLAMLHPDDRDENHRLVQAVVTAWTRRWFSSRSSGCSMASHCR
jgi:hypothetical protein